MKNINRDMQSRAKENDMNLMTYEPKEFLESFLVNGPLFDRDLENFNWPCRRADDGLKVNISETAENYTLVAEMPGVKENDVELEVKDGTLTLKAHQKKEEESSDATYRVREFSERHFERSFKVGRTVDQDNITAKLEDGLLRVTLPKREDAKAKTVKIEVTA